MRLSKTLTLALSATSLATQISPIGPLSTDLIYVGESEGATYIDEHNITYVGGNPDDSRGSHGEEVQLGIGEDYEFIDVIDIEEDQDEYEYDENGLYIEYDYSDIERKKNEEVKPPSPEDEEYEWDEEGQLFKKKCCETFTSFLTKTMTVKARPTTKTFYKTVDKTIKKTVVKTAVQVSTKSYKLPPQTKTVKFAVTVTTTIKLAPETVTETSYKPAKTVTEKIAKSVRVTKTRVNESTVTKTCTEYETKGEGGKKWF